MTRRSTRPGWRAHALPLAAALGFALQAHPARAEALVDLASSWFTPPLGSSFLKSHPFSVSLSKSSIPPVVTVDVAADSRLGTLRAAANGIRFDNGFRYDGRRIVGLGDATAQAVIIGSGRFLNVLPGQVATLDFFIHGSFEKNPSPPGMEGAVEPAGQASAFFDINAYSSAAGVSSNANIAFLSYPKDDQTYPPLCPMYTVCRLGFESGFEYGTLTIPLTGDPYTFKARLDLQVYGYNADFMHTAGLYLNVPEGVTFVPDADGFLSQATPISAVPEPGSAALFAVGLFTALGARRVRRARSIGRETCPTLPPPP